MAEFQCQLSLAAIIDFYKLCRRVCLKTIINNSVTNKRIGGFGLTVEIGTTNSDKVMKAKNCRKMNSKSIKINRDLMNERNHFILIGICRETKESFVTQINEQTVDVVLPLILQYVSTDSIIVTNLWKTIPTLEPRLQGLGYDKCKALQTAQKPYLTFIERSYHIKFSSSNPGLKYETILSHISHVFPGAFINQINNNCQHF
jgi:hypothetical protein